MVAELVIRVVVDVLRHVAIQDLESGGVERISAVDSRDFIVLRSAEFGVLCPQISLDLLGRGKKLQGSQCRPW